MLSKLPPVPNSRPPLIPSSVNFTTLSVNRINIEHNSDNDIQLTTLIGDITGEGINVINTTLSNNVVSLNNLNQYEPLSIICSNNNNELEYINTMKPSGSVLTVVEHGLEFIELPNNESLPYGKIFIGNSNNVAEAQTMQGDITIEPNGNMIISDHVITNNKLSHSSGPCILGVPNNQQNQTIQYIQPDGNNQQFLIGSTNSIEWGTFIADHLPLNKHHVFIGINNIATSKEVTGDVEIINNEFKLHDHVVTFDKIQPISDHSILGNSTNINNETVSEIASNNNNQVLKRSGTSLIFDQLTNANIHINANIEISKLETVNPHSVILTHDSTTITSLQPTSLNTILMYKNNELVFDQVVSFAEKVLITKNDSINTECPIIFVETPMNEQPLFISSLSFHPSEKRLSVDNIHTNSIIGNNRILTFFNDRTELLSSDDIHIIPQDGNLIIGPENEQIETIIHPEPNKSFTIMTPFNKDLTCQIHEIDIIGSFNFAGGIGGGVNIIAGKGIKKPDDYWASGAGGPIHIHGGEINIITGTGGSSNAGNFSGGTGGDCIIGGGNGGTGWVRGEGGDVTIQAGHGGNIKGNGGNVQFIGGTSEQLSSGGGITVQGGDGPTSSVSGKGGDIIFTGGNSQVPGGSGGSIEFHPGTNGYCNIVSTLYNNQLPRFFKYISWNRPFVWSEQIPFDETLYDNYNYLPHERHYRVPISGYYCFMATVSALNANPFFLRFDANLGIVNIWRNRGGSWYTDDPVALLSISKTGYCPKDTLVSAYIFRHVPSNATYLGRLPGGEFLSTFSGYCITPD